MQSTSLGANVTGASLAPDAVKAMGRACAALSPFDVPDLAQEQERMVIVKAWLTDIVHEHPQPAAV